MTDHETESMVDGRPEQTQPERTGRQTQQSLKTATAEPSDESSSGQKRTAALPGQHAKPGRKPLFGH